MARSFLGLHPRKPRGASLVPPSWEASSSIAADLHRRIHRTLDRTRRTLADARRGGVPVERFESLCDDDLAAVARALDDQLVHASRLPVAVRHEVLLELRYEIAEFERTGDRIGRTALAATSPLAGSVDDSLRAINQRLDLTIEARAELRELGG
jgi:hypothetical protein